MTLDGTSQNAVTDLAGIPIDGDWTDSVSAYPSGNGSAGGDLVFRFNVLPGDVTQDGAVDTNYDLPKVLVGLGTTAQDAAYSIFADINADGVIDSNHDLVDYLAGLLDNILPEADSLSFASARRARTPSSPPPTASTADQETAASTLITSTNLRTASFDASKRETDSVDLMQLLDRPHSTAADALTATDGPEDAIDLIASTKHVAIVS